MELALKDPGPLKVWTAASVPSLLIFGAMIAGGADNAFLALLTSSLAAGLLLIFLMSPGHRRDLARIPNLAPVAVLFLCTLLVAVWSLTPFSPGGTHPVWAYVPALGAATIARSQTLIEILKLCGLAAFFVSGAIMARSEEFGRKARYAVLAGGVIFALKGLTHVGNGDSVWAGRLTAGLASPNIAGTALGILFILAMTTLGARNSSGRQNRGEKLVFAYAPAAGLMLLFLACLFLTASRGAIAATGIAALVYLGLMLTARKITLLQGSIAVAALAVIGGGLALTRGTLALHRFGAVSADTSARAVLFSVHLAAFQTSPLMGFGLGAFDAINKLEFTRLNYAAVWNVRAAHDVYLQWLDEAGLIGAAPMFLCIGLILITTLFLSVGQRRHARWIRAMLAVDALVMIHGATDFALQVPSVAALWAYLLGLQLGATKPDSGR